MKALIIYLVILLAVGYGWIMNIVSMIHMDVVTTGMGVARIAGIFVPPLGAILGYF